MAKSGKHTGGISTVSFTPNGGSTAVVTGNISVDVMIGDQLVEFISDAAKFATLLANVKGDRGLRLSGYDIGKIVSAFSEGPGTLVVVVNDAVNGTGAGALTYTLTNAKRGGIGINHRVLTADTGSVSYTGYSPDGVTDSLTVTQAT